MWAELRQWQQRLVQYWLQHLSGLLHQHMGAQHTWSKWQLVWKHYIDMSHSGRYKQELRRGTHGIYQEHLKSFRYLFFCQPPFTSCYPIICFSLTTIFLYTELQSGWQKGLEEVVLSISLPPQQEQLNHFIILCLFFL